MGDAAASVINTNNLLKLDCADKITSGTLLFHKFTPPTLKLDHTTLNTWTPTGSLVTNNGGAVNPMAGTFTLERILDTSGDLWKWFSDTNTNGMQAEQATVTITVLAADGTTSLAVWTFTNTTPISYQHSAHDANSNAVMTESVTFYSTEIQYAPGSGS
jgi:hypothetical protein